MKRLLAFILFSFAISIYSYSQDTVFICHPYHPLPEKTHGLDCFNHNYIGSGNGYGPLLIENSVNNEWQIGHSKKFNHGPTDSLLAIMTDTLNSYAPDSHSVFSITIIGNLYSHTLMLNFNHYYQTDSARDGGKIEVWDPQEGSWRNIIYMNENLIDNYNLYNAEDTVMALGNEPGFSGDSNGAKDVFFGYYHHGSDSEIDTIRLRFVFASDEIDSEKDGWAISGFDIFSAYEGIEKSDFSDINIYPNPVTDLSVIDLSHIIHPERICIYSSTGVKIIDECLDAAEYEISGSELSPGCYYIRVISAGQRVYSRRFMVLEH